jgi:autotransporter-associated beta strand protein
MTTVSSGATLRLNGFATTLGSLAGVGTVDNGSAAAAATLTVGENHASTTFTGTLTNGGTQPLNLTKTGGGTLTLQGASNYTGQTVVFGGRLVADHNSALGTSAVTINGGALEIPTTRTVTNAVALNAGSLIVNGTYSNNLTVAGRLAGAGLVNGAASVVGGGVVSPGNSVGTLTVNSATFDAGSLFEVEISGNGDSPSTRDQLIVSGILNFVTSGVGSTIRVVQLSGSFDPSTTHTYTIAMASTLQVDGNPIGSPSGIHVDSSQFASPGSFSLSRAGNNLILTFTPVPEPALTLLVFASGLGGAGYVRRRLARHALTP